MKGLKQFIKIFGLVLLAAALVLLVVIMYANPTDQVKTTFDVVNFVATLVISVVGLVIAVVEWRTHRSEQEKQLEEQRRERDKQKSLAAVLEDELFAKWKAEAFSDAFNETFDTATLSNCEPAEMGSQCKRVSECLDDSVELFRARLQSVQKSVRCTLEHAHALPEKCVSLALQLNAMSNELLVKIDLFDSDLLDYGWWIIEHESIIRREGESEAARESAHMLYVNACKARRSFIELLAIVKAIAHTIDVLVALFKSEQSTDAAESEATE